MNPGSPHPCEMVPSHAPFLLNRQGQCCSVAAGGRERCQEGSDCKKLIMIQFLLPWSPNTGHRSYISTALDLYDRHMVVIYCVMSKC